MCFSATVSFGAGAVLIPLGGWALCEALARPEPEPGLVSLAAAPLMFGVQQVAEGLVWRALDAGQGARGPALGFLAFAYWAWLVWTPLTAWLLARGRLRWLLAGLTAVGAAYGGALYLPLLGDDGNLLIWIEGHSIRYITWVSGWPRVSPILSRGLYLVCTLTPFLLVPRPRVRLFGAALAGSAIVALLTRAVVFVSVWCFLAAWLSVLLALIVRRERQGLRQLTT